MHYDADDPATFEAEIAAAVNTLVANPKRARAMGAAGRLRAEREFSWRMIAQQTVAVYRAAIEARQ